MQTLRENIGAVVVILGAAAAVILLLMGLSSAQGNGLVNFGEFGEMEDDDDEREGGERDDDEGGRDDDEGEDDDDDEFEGEGAEGLFRVGLLAGIPGVLTVAALTLTRNNKGGSKKGRKRTNKDPS